VSDGPYRFTRNPQYLGDGLLFIGLSLIANSLHLWITHALLVLVFVLAPLTEEQWLEEQYGQTYAEYKRSVPRFL
jgi:protein-S-isoprenylcysteine O-methyltransferase Ste14